MAGGRIWKKKEMEFLMKNYPQMTTREIAEKLGRSVSAVRDKIAKLGIAKYPTRKWSVEEEDYLKENHRKMRLKDIAYILGRTVSAVKDRVKDLGMAKKKKKKLPQKQSAIVTFKHESGASALFDFTDKVCYISFGGNGNSRTIRLKDYTHGVAVMELLRSMGFRKAKI
jgi:predicted transcriptional regulator